MMSNAGVGHELGVARARATTGTQAKNTFRVVGLGQSA